MIKQCQEKEEILETISTWIDSLTFKEDNALEIRIEPNNVIEASYDLAIKHDVKGGKDE